MTVMSPLLILLFILTAVIGLAGVCAAIVLSLRLQRLKLQVRRDRASTPADPAPSEPVGTFQTPLLRATLKQRLGQHQPQQQAPDKYRKASELAALGMSAQQIADLLSLPPAEVRQLINLSRARRTVAAVNASLEAGYPVYS